MDQEKARLVQRKLRESHRVILTRNTILLDHLFDVLTSLRETQDEMVKLIEADDELDDAIKSE